MVALLAIITLTLTLTFHQNPAQDTAALDKNRQTAQNWQTAQNQKKPAPALVQNEKIPDHKESSQRDYTDISQVFHDLKTFPSDWQKYIPNEITVCPYPDLPVEFKKTEPDKIIKGRTVQIFRNGDDSLVIAATKSEMVATLSFHEADEFEIHTTRKNGENSIAIASIQPGLCANPDFTGEPGAKPGAQAFSAPAAALTRENGNTEEIHTVNVLFYCSEAAYEYYDALYNNDRDQIITRLIAEIETANLVLENSHASNLRWAFKACLPFRHYAETSNISNDLLQLDSTPQTSRDMKNAGAGQAILLVGNDKGIYSGMAYLNGTAAVVRAADGYKILTHELGHGFGCQHDRDTMATSNQSHAHAYNYGYIFPNNQATGTIMAYAHNAIPCFSNPNILYNEKPAGVDIGHPEAAYNVLLLVNNAQTIASRNPEPETPVILAQPENKKVHEHDPVQFFLQAAGKNLDILWFHNGHLAFATSANEDKTEEMSHALEGTWHAVAINQNDSAISNPFTISMLDASKFMPVITAHPKSASHHPGGTIYLIVDAHGQNLSYQWLKNGHPTDTTTRYFLKPNTTKDDSGSYSVRVSNQYGSVTSLPATITILQEIESHPAGVSLHPPETSSGGGGGGGGAPSIPMLLALSILILYKLYKRQTKETISQR